MVVDLNGDFITGRSHPKLVQVNPRIEGERLSVSAPGMMTLDVDIERLQGLEPIKVIVWGQIVDAVDAGEESARWFSRYLLQEDFGYRLMYYPSSIPTRESHGKNGFFGTSSKDFGAFHDARSFMMINEASMLELNSRLKHPISALQFRPNFVVKGAPAFAEDDWRWLRIGDEAIFENVKPCKR